MADRLARSAEAKHIGKMTAFLASEDTRSVSGRCIHAGGGVILRD